ncbi:MAG: hypothetical protein IT379_11975 [Deltaproteobacteria bacterium]|nr:hypothetical protein [Deltaproteobacteria bacterium]
MSTRAQRAIIATGTIGIVGFALAVLAITTKLVPADLGLSVIGASLVGYTGALAIGVLLLRRAEQRRAPRVAPRARLRARRRRWDQRVALQ